MTAEALQLTAEGARRPIRRIERLADQGGLFQVYLFEVERVTRTHIRALARHFRNLGVPYFLLVLAAADYERVDFVLLEPYLPEEGGKGPGISTRQARLRPRVLSVERRKPTNLDLRVLRRFTWTEPDPFAQYDKLPAAYTLAEWSEEEFNNRALFADYYLLHRLPEDPVWKEDSKPDPGRKGSRRASAPRRRPLSLGCYHERAQRSAHGRGSGRCLRLRADEDENPIMNAIFLGGSRRITRLAPEVRQCLDQLIEESSRVLIGDANGADRAFQQYLSQRRYPNVTVFSSLTMSRNNLGQWPMEHVEPPHKTRDFAFFTAKDAEMARRADRALMIWDGKSAGTIVNVARLVAAGKPVIVYMGPRRSLRTIESVGYLESLLDACPPAERSRIDRRIGEHVGGLVQPSLF